MTRTPILWLVLMFWIAGPVCYGWAREEPAELSSRCVPGLWELLRTDPGLAADQARTLVEEGEGTPECLLVWAQAQILAGRPIWALRTLVRWSTESHGVVGASAVWYQLLLCQALYASQQFELASEACGHPALSGMWAASYCQGMSYFYQDRFPEAVRALSAASLALAPDSHRSSARGFRHLSMLGEWGMTPGLKGSLEARGGVDSNPYFAGEDVPLLNGDTPDSAMFYRLTAFLDWNSPPLGPHWIRLSGFAAQNAYPGSDARDISGLTVAAQAEGVRLLRLGGRTATLRLLAGADSVLLQGGPRMREGAPHIFRRDLFFGGGFAWLISPRLRLGLELEAAQGRFRELARNGWMQTLRVPATIALSESLSLAGGLRCSYHHTDSAYRRWETGLNAAVRWRFFGGLSALAGAGLDWASHPNSSSYFGGDRNREDWTWALRGAVHWQAWPHVQFFVDGEARGRTSTSPGFDFGRFLASGGARWEF